MAPQWGYLMVFGWVVLMGLLLVDVKVGLLEW
jgi:hypothetical protein